MAQARKQFEKRVKSPTSATRTTALITALPASPATRQRLRADSIAGEGWQLLLDPLEAPFRIRDGIDVVLERDLLAGFLKVDVDSHRRSAIRHPVPRRPCDRDAAEHLEDVDARRHGMSDHASQDGQSHMAS